MSGTPSEVRLSSSRWSAAAPASGPPRPRTAHALAPRPAVRASAGLGAVLGVAVASQVSRERRALSSYLANLDRRLSASGVGGGIGGTATGGRGGGAVAEAGSVGGAGGCGTLLGSGSGSGGASGSRPGSTSVCEASVWRGSAPVPSGAAVVPNLGHPRASTSRAYRPRRNSRPAQRYFRTVFTMASAYPATWPERRDHREAVAVSPRQHPPALPPFRRRNSPPTGHSSSRKFRYSSFIRSQNDR